MFYKHYPRRHRRSCDIAQGDLRFEYSRRTSQLYRAHGDEDIHPVAREIDDLRRFDWHCRGAIATCLARIFGLLARTHRPTVAAGGGAKIEHPREKIVREGKEMDEEETVGEGSGAVEERKRRSTTIGGKERRLTKGSREASRRGIFLWTTPEQPPCDYPGRGGGQVRGEGAIYE